MASTFWRTELQRELARRRAIPGAVSDYDPNGLCLVDEPDEALLKLMSRAHDEEMQAFLPELRASQRRVTADRAVAKHQRAREQAQAVRTQQLRLRLRLRVRDLDFPRLTSKQRLALRLADHNLTPSTRG